MTRTRSESGLVDTSIRSDRGRHEALHATGQSRMGMGGCPGARSVPMSTSFEAAVTNYLRSGTPARETRNEYHTTLAKWKQWQGGVPIEQIGRREIREFLDWVHARAM